MTTRITILTLLLFISSLGLCAQPGKYGMINIKGEAIIPFRYDTIYPEFFDPYLNVVRQNNKYGLLDMQGKMLAACEYDEISHDPVRFVNDCFQDPDNMLVSPTTMIKAPDKRRKVRKGLKWGLINQYGELAVKCKYDSLVFHHGHTYRARMGDKWGLIDISDKEYIKPIFDRLETFGDHLSVQVKGKWGVIDTLGRGVAPPVFDTLLYKNNSLGLYIAYKDKKAALAGFDKSVPIPPMYNYLEIAHNILIAQKGNLYGLIDIDNEPITPFEFTKIEKMKNGEAISLSSPYFTVWEESMAGAMDPEGDLVVEIEYDDIKEYMIMNSSFALKQDGKWGMSYRFNRVDIPIEYDDIHYAKSHEAIVERKHMWGVIGIDNKAVIPIEYDSITVLQEYPMRFYKLQQNGKVGIANEEGKIVLPVRYDKIVSGKHVDGGVIFVQRHGGRWGALDNEDLRVIIPYECDEMPVQGSLEYINHFMVKKKGKYGFLDQQGKEIIPFRYNRMKEYTDVDPPVFVVR